MKKMVIFEIVLVLVFLFSIQGFAEEDPADSLHIKYKKQKEVKEVSETDPQQIKNYLGMTLEELLEIEITTASKRKERISEAPAIISVITKKELIERGHLTLYDALTSLPGVNAIQTYWGFNQLFFRGIYSTLYNDKSLVLINGHPFWGSINGSYYIEAFPVEAIEKIEVIRGPGSTLYGTNAFAGVINIVTPKGKSIKGSDWALRSSSPEDVEGQIIVGDHQNDFNWMVTGGMKKGDGYDAIVPEDELGNKDITFDFINNYNTFYAQIDYKGLSLDIHTFSQKKSKIDAIPAVWGTLEQTRNSWNGFFGGIKYAHSLNEKMDVNARFSYNTFWRVFDSRLSGNYLKYDSDGSRTDGELSLNYNFSKDLSIMTGIHYEFMKADHYNVYDLNTGEISDIGLTGEEVDDSNMAGYVQGDFRFWRNLRFIGGTRILYNEDYGSFVSPRASVVFKLKENLHLKALYGSAFRAPNLFEKYADFATTLGNTDLDPEKVNTFETGIDYTFNKINLKANYYYTIASDLIGRKLLPDNKTQYTNVDDELTFQGVEGEIRAYFRKLDIYMNGSYLSGKDTEDNDIPYIPNILWNGGVIFSDPHWLASLNFNHIGECTNQLSSTGEDVDIESTLLLNTKVGYRLPFDLTASVIVHNVLDEEIWAPEFIRRKIGKLQNGAGRQILLELRKSF